MKKGCIVFLLFLLLLALLSSCSSSVKECGKYKSIGANYTCITNAALKSRDPSICKQGRPDYCYYVMWNEFPQEAICHEVEDPQIRDRCHRDVATIKKDISSCHEIANVSIKDKCLAAYYPQKHVDVCNIISNKVLRDDCAINIAANERNYGLCDSMTLALRDKCYTSTAIRHGDAEKCGSIVMPEMRDYCISHSGKSSITGQS